MSGIYVVYAFFVSLLSLILLRPLAIKYKLVDYPNERKKHTGNVPLIGGISVFLGVSISYLFFIEFDKFSNMLLITALFILIHGVWDDYTNLKASTKIHFQILISAIMIYVTDVKLESFGDLFGISYPIELGIFSVPITIVAVIALTNAINMMDGLDGLAAGIVLLAIIGLLYFYLTLEIPPIFSILLAIVFALFPFIIFNIAPYRKMKIFLGDGGSLSLGYIISWALIYSPENVRDFNPSFSLWCIAIPLFDFLFVIIRRIVKKQSLITPNRDHIHHFFADKEFSNFLILLLIIFFGLTVLIIGIFIENNFPDLSFSVFATLFLFYLFIRMYTA
jgi:UDP-GlcNAc:undecaprenyl-phosphate GlcNAc-1-phosphate transferase